MYISRSFCAAVALLAASSAALAQDAAVLPDDASASASVTAIEGAPDVAASEPLPKLGAAAPPHSKVRPIARTPNVPATRWTHQPGHVLWNRTALSALKTHGKPLVDVVPADIGDWCPRYPDASSDLRAAFWVGFMSALAKFESTYKPEAVGGGGRWYGLLQILPATARGYGCNVGTGAALQNGAANLSCAARIMAVTVPRDGVIYAPGGRGVAADWGPMRSRTKRADMASWLRRQSYCEPVSSTRPQSRPIKLAAD
ncbi:MAG: transglycosylase SLT domain-containing protein [Tateyamaria sp.]|uniref:transglycosylase SLT domain-containing protein n=1 Tax=Tateyamaria sp. TaxID=1929288 RepID=UPI00329BBC9F